MHDCLVGDRQISLSLIQTLMLPAHMRAQVTEQLLTEFLAEQKAAKQGADAEGDRQQL